MELPVLQPIMKRQSNFVKPMNKENDNDVKPELPVLYPIARFQKFIQPKLEPETPRKSSPRKKARRQEIEVITLEAPQPKSKTETPRKSNPQNTRPLVIITHEVNVSLERVNESPSPIKKSQHQRVKINLKDLLEKKIEIRLTRIEDQILLEEKQECASLKREAPDSEFDVKDVTMSPVKRCRPPNSFLEVTPIFMKGSPGKTNSFKIDNVEAEHNFEYLYGKKMVLLLRRIDENILFNIKINNREALSFKTVKAEFQQDDDKILEEVEPAKKVKVPLAFKIDRMKQLHPIYNQLKKRKYRTHGPFVYERRRRAISRRSIVRPIVKQITHIQCNTFNAGDLLN